MKNLGFMVRATLRAWGSGGVVILPSGFGASPQVL